VNNILLVHGSKFTKITKFDSLTKRLHTVTIGVSVFSTVYTPLPSKFTKLTKFDPVKTKCLPTVNIDNLKKIVEKASSSKANTPPNQRLGLNRSQKITALLKRHPTRPRSSTNDLASLHRTWLLLLPLLARGHVVSVSAKSRRAVA
jgi:hypothetical protein